MQITLNQDEIHEAVDTYVRSQISVAPNQTISIDFTAGRGTNGLSATLSINSPVAASTTRIKPVAAVSKIAIAEPDDDVPDEETPQQESAREDTVASKAPKANPFNKNKAAAPAAVPVDPVEDEADDVVIEDDPVSDEDEDEAPPAKSSPKSIFSKAG